MCAIMIAILVSKDVVASDDVVNEETLVDGEVLEARKWWKARLEPNIFGGVLIGRSNYPFLIRKSDSYYDGRGSGYFQDVTATTVSSSYLSRIGNTRFYTGFGISASFSALGKSEQNANNPYCTPSSEEKITNDGSGGYLYCENFLSTQTINETMFHIPAEWQISYAYRPIENIMFNGGMAISINYYNYQYEMNQAGVGFNSYYDEDSKFEEEIAYFWTEDFRQEVPMKFKSPVPGVAFFGSADLIFGKLPRIGGNWGVTASVKWSRVVWDYRKITPSYSVSAESLEYEYDIDSYSDNKYNDDGFVELTNTSFGIGLSYHY